MLRRILELSSSACSSSPVSFASSVSVCGTPDRFPFGRLATLRERPQRWLLPTGHFDEPMAEIGMTSEFGQQFDVGQSRELAIERIGSRSSRSGADAVNERVGQPSFIAESVLN